MLRFFLRRATILVPTVFGVTVVAFLFVHALPGDPVLLLAGERGLTADRYQEQLHRFQGQINHLVVVAELRRFAGWGVGEC